MNEGRGRVKSAQLFRTESINLILKLFPRRGYASKHQVKQNNNNKKNPVNYPFVRSTLG